MMGLLKLIPKLGVLLCVATVLAQAGGAGYLFATGRLSSDKWFALLAAYHDVDLVALHDKKAQELAEKQAPPPLPELIERVRTLDHLDLDLREQALDKGLVELRTLETNLKEERRRYDQLKTSFDQALAKLEANARTEGIQETQRTLEVLPPKQAKDQILKMMADNGVNDVVAVFKGMSLDKRKKIVAEFKEASESEKLYEIMRQIRSGDPETKLITDTRQNIQPQQPGNL